MGYVKLNRAVEATGLHPNTLRKYADQGHIPSTRTPGGQRLFDVSALFPRREATVCYARVSSRKQKGDLERQVQWLRDRYPDAEVVRDIGSGLNWKRPGLRAILERSVRGEKLTVVVAHRDRLARFAHQLIEWLLCLNDGQLVVLGKSSKGSPESELTADLLAVLTVFAARVQGFRRYRREVEKDSSLPDSEPAIDFPPVDGNQPARVQQDHRASE